MGKKLNIRDSFPGLTVNVCDGRSFNSKANLDAKYNIVLFYRGIGDPYTAGSWPTMKRMKEALAHTNTKVISAGSVDGAEKIHKLLADLAFPIAVAVTH